MERKSELPEVGSTTPSLVLLEAHRDDMGREQGTWYVRGEGEVSSGALTPSIWTAPDRWTADIGSKWVRITQELPPSRWVCGVIKDGTGHPAFEFPESGAPILMPRPFGVSEPASEWVKAGWIRLDDAKVSPEKEKETTKLKAAEAKIVNLESELLDERRASASRNQEIVKLAEELKASRESVGRLLEQAARITNDYNRAINKANKSTLGIYDALRRTLTSCGWMSVKDQRDEDLAGYVAEEIDTTWDALERIAVAAGMHEYMTTRLGSEAGIVADTVVDQLERYQREIGTKNKDAEGQRETILGMESIFADLRETLRQHDYNVVGMSDADVAIAACNEIRDVNAVAGEAGKVLQAALRASGDIESDVCYDEVNAIDTLALMAARVIDETWTALEDVADRAGEEMSREDFSPEYLVNIAFEHAEESLAAARKESADKDVVIQAKKEEIQKLRAKQDGALRSLVIEKFSPWSAAASWDAKAEDAINGIVDALHTKTSMISDLREDVRKLKSQSGTGLEPLVKSRLESVLLGNNGGLTSEEVVNAVIHHVLSGRQRIEELSDEIQRLRDALNKNNSVFRAWVIQSFMPWVSPNDGKDAAESSVNKILSVIKAKEDRISELSREVRFVEGMRNDLTAEISELRAKLADRGRSEAVKNLEMFLEKFAGSDHARGAGCNGDAVDEVKMRLEAQVRVINGMQAGVLRGDGQGRRGCDGGRHAAPRAGQEGHPRPPCEAGQGSICSSFVQQRKGREHEPEREEADRGDVRPRTHRLRDARPPVGRRRRSPEGRHGQQGHPSG